jgi:hypothetical protein
MFNHVNEVRMKALSALWNSIQTWLLPELTEEIGELSGSLQQFVAVCEVAQLDRFMAVFRRQDMGRPPRDRLALLKGFVLKATLNLGTTRALIDYLRHCPQARRLCGYETVGQVPSEATFSRAFAQFALTRLPVQIHAAMVGTHYQGKLVGHLSRDSAAIAVPERSAVKAKAPAVPSAPEPPPKRPRGRPRKGEVRPPRPPRRLALQPGRTLAENLADLPVRCDRGAKRDSQGHLQCWRGYKVHVDVADGDVPISVVLSSASMHDSQAAIPLAQLSAQRVTSLYDLMDAAYDAAEIRQHSRSLGHVPLIDHNPKQGEKRPFAPAEAVRFHQRSSAERFVSHLDAHGRHTVRVRGHLKVLAHLMFGILVVTVEQMLTMLC